jgi:hypothetical protein
MSEPQAVLVELRLQRTEVLLVRVEVLLEHGNAQGVVEVLNGMPRFREREHAQKARRLLALTSTSLQLGQARKEGERDTLALAETLGCALVFIDEPDGAALIRDALGRAGLRILTGRSISQVIAGPDGVVGVLLDSGEELPCEIVCIGSGAKQACAASTPLQIRGTGLARRTLRS